MPVYNVKLHRTVNTWFNEEIEFKFTASTEEKARDAIEQMIVDGEDFEDHPNLDSDATWEEEVDGENHEHTDQPEIDSIDPLEV